VEYEKFNEVVTVFLWNFWGDVS